MRRAVLFDLDGTLVDTPTGIVRVVWQVLSGSSRPRVPEAEVRATIGRPLDVVFSSLLELPADHEQVRDAVARFREVFARQVVPGAAGLVFPGVLDLLAELRARGRPLAIVTSKIRASAEELLSAGGLLSAFDTVVGHDMAPRGKPHPDLALLAADRLGVAAADCVVVGDSVDDMRMAVSAGMAAIGVGFGVGSAEQLREHGAELVVASPAGLPAALGIAPAVGATERWSA